MPIFKAGSKLVLYSHVPKCGGSAVSWYLQERFGQVAFHDSRHTRHDPASLWSRTSPQHIDSESLDRLFPAGFFDAVFTIVRHPVARLVSAYHFQLEVEQIVSTRVSFSDWLADLTERRAEDPFIYDNHVRPMAEIVPQGAKVFHMEHGLDALVPWFDRLTGGKDGPRAVPRINEQGAYTGKGKSLPKATPTDADLELITRLYGEDFARFGYRIGEKAPDCPPPTLTAQQIAERDAMLRDFNSPIGRIRRKLSTRLGS